MALAVLANVYLFCQGRFIMNSMEGTQMIPAYVEYENTLVFGSRHTFWMVRLTTSAQRTSWAFLAGIKNSIFLSRRHKRKHLTRKNSSNI